MTVPYQNKSSRWSGDLFIDPYVNDAPSGNYRQVGNASEFVIGAPTVEKAEQTGHMRQNFGQTIASVVTKNEREVSFVMTDYYKENLVLALFGEDALDNQSAGNDASAQDVTAALGLWVDLGHRQLDPDNPPVVQDATDTTTYVEGTDYEVDYQSGLLLCLAGGAITNAETLHVASTWLASDGYAVQADQNTSIYAKLRLVGENKVDNSYGEVIVYKAQLEPSSDLPWIGEDWGTISMSGKILATTSGSFKFNSYD